MISISPQYMQSEESLNAKRFQMLMERCTKASVRSSKEDDHVKQIVIEFTKPEKGEASSSEFFRHDLTQAIDEMLGL